MGDKNKPYKSLSGNAKGSGKSDNKAKPVQQSGGAHFARPDDPEVQLKRNLIFEERARAQIKQSKFFEASNSLKEVECEDDDEESQFGLNLLKAECYIQLGMELRASKAIKALRNALLEGPHVNPDLLISLGESLRGKETFLRSLILLWIASELYVKQATLGPNEIVDSIARCIQVAKDILAETSKEKSSGNLMDLLALDENDRGDFLKKALGQGNTDDTRKRFVIIDYGIEYMKDMLTNLRSVNGADPERKVLKEAWSITHIGFILAVLKEYDKSYKIRKEGVEAMDAVFGDRSGLHHVYSVLLHNMGVVLHNNDKYAEAKEVYEKAIVAKEMALDHGGQDKEEDIQDTRKAIEVTRRHMR